MFNLHNIRREIEQVEHALQSQQEPRVVQTLQKIVFIADANLGFSVNQLCVGLAGAGEQSIATDEQLEKDFEFLHSLAKQASVNSFKMSNKQKDWSDDIRKRLDKACQKHDKELQDRTTRG